MVVLTKRYQIMHIAQHTEEEQKFVVYASPSSKDLLLHDLSLRETLLTFSPETTILPVHFQLPEIIDTVWEHFKSKPEDRMTYLVHGFGVNLRNLSQEFVLYSPQYPRGQQLLQGQLATCLARPKEMFFSQVERDGYQGPRFRKI